MGGGKCNANFTWSQSVGERLICCGTVRIEQVVLLLPSAGYGADDILVGVGESLHYLAHGGVVAKQFLQSREIARVATVHRYCQRRFALAWHKLARAQILGENVVFIVGNDNSLDRKTHFSGNHRSGEVAEVATRHRHHHLAHVVALFCQLTVCPEVIESLRKQSGYIHALGTGEQHFFRQFGVVERLHHYVFAVGERTVHLDGGDIATERGELCDLERSELPLRIENIYMCALDAVETVGDGTARMTGSDGNHIDFTTALFGGVVVRQQTRHEASANVLETHGRAMKQLQNVAIVAHVDERNGEIERFEHHIVKHLRVDVALQGIVGNGVTHLLQCHVAEVHHKRLRQRGYLFGQILSAVGCISV